MAIVGTAFVRLRVIGDKLKNDIAKATSDAVTQAAPQLAESGQEVGEKISDGVGESLQRSVGEQMGKIADEIGDAIGKRMAENMGRSLRRRAGDAFANGMGAIRPQITRIGNNVSTAWEKVGDNWGKKTAGSFGRTLRMLIPAVIGGLITTLPSILAFAGAVAGALVATLVPAIGMIGPAAAGAGLAFVAAFATMKISAGLLGLAMKTPSAALDDFKERTEAFKSTIARPIQAGLLSGLNASMRIAQPIVRALTPMLTDLGIEAGTVAIKFADAFRQGAMLERLQRILTVNNDAIRLGGEGATSLAQAFAVLLDHLAPVITYLASGVRDLGNWALNAILAAEASGRLDTFIATMWTNLTRFVGILVDFGVGIFNVFRAASGESASMMTSLEGIAARFREWTGDEANQERMITFFARMRIITSRVLDILGQLATASGRALEGTDVNSVLGGLNTLVGVGESVARIFEDIRESAGPQLSEAFTNFGNMLRDLAESGVIGNLAQAFSYLFQAISMLLNIPGLGSLITLALGMKTLFMAVSMVMTVLRPVLGLFRLLGWAIGILVGAFGIIPVAIGAVVLALVWFFTQTELGREIIASVWEFIKNAISVAVDGIVAAWNWLVEAFQAAVAWVVGLAQQIWTAISTAFNSVVDTVVSAFTTVRDFIIGVWNAIWGFIQPIIQGIWDFIVMVVSGIVTGVQMWLNVLYEIWIRIWPLLALPIRVLYGVIILIFTEVWTFIQWIFGLVAGFVVGVWNDIYAKVSAALGWIRDVIVGAWNAVWGFIQPILQTIGSFISGVWNGIVSAVSGAMSAVWGVIVSIWNAVSGFINGVINGIRNHVSAGWNAVTDAVRGALDAAYGVVQRIWNNITSFIQGAMDRIRGIAQGAWNALGDVGSGILSGLKTAVNVVIGAINDVIGGINAAIGLANQLPGPDIPTIPRIPRLAQGGIVSPTGGGTLAMIAEAGRPERVEPLDSSGLSRRDRAMIEHLAGSGSGATVHVYLGVRELTELVDIVVEEREDSLADRVLTGAKG